MAELSALLNAMDDETARAALARCCGASRWVSGMLAARPFASDADVFALSDAIWSACEEADYREAFGHHPQIGASVAALRARFPATSGWSGAEQAGVSDADDGTLEALAAANRAYLERFGFIFIICATGKSAREMLDALAARIGNSDSAELANAAAEQLKITQLRLRKLA